MRRKPWLVFVIAGVVTAGGVWLFTSARLAGGSGASAARAPADLLGQRRPDFTLASIDGRRVSASDFDGQVLVVNFWATWCKPCREEMPMLSELHEKYADDGLQVVGIALDDIQQVREFVSELQITYPVLVGSTDVLAAGRSYGNQSAMLPYSVLIDRDGIVRWTRLGVLRRAELLQQAVAFL
jgi:peroxiredoxin